MYSKSKEKTIILILLLVGVALIAISPLLFTGNLLDWSSQYNFEKTGDIGDTIGGLTSPIVGVLGALLVYISFIKQVEANKILKHDVEKSNFYKAYDEINKLLSTTSAQCSKVNYKKKEVDVAVSNWVKDNKQNIRYTSNLEFLTEFLYFVKLVDRTSKSIEKFNALKQHESKIDDNQFFNYENLVRFKFVHFYEYKYKTMIVEFKKFHLFNEIKNSYFLQEANTYKFLKKEFINDAASYTDDKIKLYKILIGIITSVNNIEFTLIRANSLFWGEKEKNEDN